MLHRATAAPRLGRPAVGRVVHDQAIVQSWDRSNSLDRLAADSMAMQGSGMTMIVPSTVLTPNWLAHRYDPAHDAFQFVDVDRTTRARVPFLTDKNLGALVPKIIQRGDASISQEAHAPVRYIFHSAYCCSTLLANAYDRPGLSFSLKEPVILNDIVGWRHRGASPAQTGAVLADSIALLARPFTPGELCVIKPSNVVNGLAAAMIGGRADCAALLLYAPLSVYLGSIAGKGLWGRLWVRDLLAKQLTDGMNDFGFSPQDLFLQTDLQVAAVGWMTQHALFARLATTFPDRVRTLDSEVMLARPLETLAALDALFGVNDTQSGRVSIVAREFSRNAKSGGAFSALDRTAAQSDTNSVHGDEIAKVVSWAEAVAEQFGMSFVLPSPLLDS